MLTVNARDQVAEALALRDGKVLAVGSEEAVMALAGPATRVHDLTGRTLAPGFIAVHEHPAIAAVFGGVTDISGFTHPTNTAVQASLLRAVLETPEGEWIFATGLDPLLVPDLEMPTRASLDELTSRHPVVVVAQSLHSVWVNSMALELAGITRDTPDPGNGSYYERDERGEFTGFVAETSAIAPFADVLKSPWRMLTRYEDVLDDFLDAGYTTLTSLGYNAPPALARWSGLSWLRPRIRQFFYMSTDELDYLPAAPQFQDDFFAIFGIKLWYDGSPYTGSMYLDEPYLASPLATALGIEAGSRGASRLGTEEFARLLDEATAGGWPVAVHSQGDASGREVTAGLARAARRRTAVPDRIEHCLLPDDGELEELARLGVSPSFHINHLWFYGDALAEGLLGPERAARILPLGRAFALDMHPTLHADSPMFPADPMHLMQTAVLVGPAAGGRPGRHHPAGPASHDHQRRLATGPCRAPGQPRARQAGRPRGAQRQPLRGRPAQSARREGAGDVGGGKATGAGRQAVTPTPAPGRSRARGGWHANLNQAIRRPPRAD